MMNQPKYQIGDRTRYKICPECGKRSLYLADAYTYVCFECDAHFPLEYFFEADEAEPDLYDIDGDQIIY